MSNDHFEYYFYGKDFSVLTDNRALLSILMDHRSNKSYISRLSSWIDRLVTYNFTIEHMTGAKIGLVEYISRDPWPKKKLSYDKQFLVAAISDNRNSIKYLIKHKPQTLQNR